MGNPIMVEPVLPKVRLALVMGAGGLLVLLIGGLLFTFYSMQIDLEQKARERMFAHARSVADEIGRFFSDRHDDLKGITEVPLFTAAWESWTEERSGQNESSGAPPEIVGLMTSALEWERLDEQRVFSRIAICDAQGNLLAEVGSGGDPALRRIWPDFALDGGESEVEGDAGSLRLRYDLEESSVVVFLPYWGKEDIQAYLIGWIPLDLISEGLLKPSRPAGGYLCLFYSNTPIVSGGDEAEVLSPLRKVQSALPVEYSISPPGRKADRQIGMRMPVPGLPLSVAYSVPKQAVLGKVSPGALLFSLMLISVAVLGGVIGVLRYSARDLVLRSRLQETATREREIQEKNRQLEREIQDRIEVEESLRESEERTRQLLDMESDVILMVDSATGEILDVNRAASELYGYSRNELLNMTIMSLSGEPEKTSQTLLERPARVPLRWHRRKDGSVFPVEIAIRYFSWHGRDVHVAGIRDITERLRDRETIEAQSEFLRQVLDSNPNFIFVEDVEGRLILANRTFCDFFRKPYEELEGKIALEYIRGMDVAKLMYQDDLDILEGRIQRVDRELAISDHRGEDHWYHLVKRPMWDKRGVIDRIVCVCSDITNRKKAEQARAESEVRYRGLYHNAIVGLYRTAIEDGRILECNQRMAEIFGYKDRGHFMMEYAFADKYVDPEKRKILLLRLQSEGEVNGYVADMYHRDGSVIWLRYTAKLFAAEGYLEGFAIDITAQKAAEDALSRLGAAVEQAAEIIIMTDVQGTIQYVNPAFEKITGYSRNEAIGKNPHILKSGKHSQEFYRGLWDTILTGEVWKGRLTNRRKDGTLFEEEASISPIRDEKGRIVNFVAVKRDVTREAALEDQLRQAQKMEAVGQLAGGVAHDFNNLLQAIMGHAQLALADLKPDSGLSRDLEQVVSAAQKAAGLTSQLLAFSRRQVLQPKPINLGNLVENLTKMLGRLLGQHIEIQVVNDPGLGHVKADAGQMEQILMNLAVNARDAMPEGGTLTIETHNFTLDEEFCDSHAWARPGDYILLTVTDTGLGIPRHHLEHIFEPFFTTKEVGKGTGLGLATVYGIVKQHEGLIDVDSEPGKGSQFRVFIPRCDDAVVSGEADRRNEPPKGSETILIVEDDPQVRNLAVRILGKGGYRVVQAVDGEQGLRVFREKGDCIDLVLLDIVMPKMNGKVLYDKIREIAPRMPVLFSSGYSSHILNTDLVPEGDFQMIQKPYRPDDLLRRVRKVLDGRKDRESAASACVKTGFD